jgi:hypothetical protein
VGAGALPLMAQVTEQELYPAEHRGLRELHATARSLARHWEKLAEHLGGVTAEPLRAGAGSARALLDELSERGAPHAVHGAPAAQGVGTGLAGLSRGLDRVLERNQALRLALLDAQHVVTLLAWLGALAERRGDEGWAAFHRGWGARMAEAEDAVRGAVFVLATDPDGAIEPADESALGRAGQRAAVAMGSLGEAIDSSPLGRAVRRRLGRTSSGG